MTAFTGSRTPRSTQASGAASLVERFLHSAAVVGAVTAEAVRMHRALESATTPAAQRAVLERYVSDHRPTRAQDTSAATA